MLVEVIGDRSDNDSGFVGQWLVAAGAELVPLDRDRLPEHGSGDRADLLVLLGSARSAHAAESADVVAAESAYVRSTLLSRTPVLGFCYDGQLLAHAPGGTVTSSPVPEIGFFEVESRDAALCPPGPWVQMHSDAFVPPESSRAPRLPPRFGRKYADYGGVTGVFASKSWGEERRRRADCASTMPAITSNPPTS